ncbi:hypothetical protein V1971_33900, partial [Pseudomonas aeruginosa]
LSSVYDIGAAPYRKGQVLHSVFAAARLSDLCLMTSVTKSQINDLRPSQLAKLRDACKEVNPHFFGMLGRLSKLHDKP